VIAATFPDNFSPIAFLLFRLDQGRPIVPAGRHCHAASYAGETVGQDPDSQCIGATFPALSATARMATGINPQALG
jgi:hypothetical protein